ncbi:hypothetical protein HK100_000574 [Physocladia obscura]|uniref:Glycoside hydrolase family 31 N-terminal domain-containing protein n=1 Tax=Physocladia obscura TaxID=109957 RepID=A0AAD5SYE9_9FUNG|nr:hypothetical protein HK100_000574 [Physocladia obscura]
MREYIPAGYTLQEVDSRNKHEVLRLSSSVVANGIGAGTRQAVLTLQVLDEATVRVRHFAVSSPSSSPANTLDPPQKVSHAVISSTNSPVESTVSATVTTNTDGLGFTVTTRALSIRVNLTPDERVPHLSFSSKTNNNQWQPFREDLPHRAYPLLLERDGSVSGVRHFLRRRDEDLHYGLGERASPLTLNGRRFRLETMDALGYNATSTDPLYKLVPFHITLDTTTRVAHGVYYDSFSSGNADFGKEIDAFWGPYTSHTLSCAGESGLDMYIFLGPRVADVVRKYASLVGRPAFPPKYALGYLASAMGYAEAEDAQTQIAKLPELCRKYDVSCDLLHLSSGYTVDENTGARNVFTWNRTRFPDPEKLFKDLRTEGIRVSANVKPWLLSKHPDYEKVFSGDGFVKNSETNSARITRLWSAGNGTSATGSYFDFSSETGLSFWKSGITALLATGIESIWNDNNEFALPDDADTYAHDASWFRATAGGDTQPAAQVPITVGDGGRGLQTLLMARASHEAMRAAVPGRRPFLITRSAVSGVQRYAAQTWSGDNYTSWHTLKHNIPMGLNCGLSGFPGYGHDVGGFVGPRPGKELFVRWIQNGVWHPRFCVHSWKDEGVTELWMYPDASVVFPIIREAVRLRYKILPYLYTLTYEASKYGDPVIRPLVYEFQHDAAIQEVSFEFMLGPHLLIASVFEEGSVTRYLRLPQLVDEMRNENAWCNVWTGIWYSGGSGESGEPFQCPLSQCGVVFAKRGAIIPTGPVLKHVGQEGADNERVFWVFPPPPGLETMGEVWNGYVYEDDGESETIAGNWESISTEIAVKMEIVESEVVISVEFGRHEYKIGYQKVWFLLPIGDVRKVRILGRENFERVESDSRLAIGCSLL